MSDTYSLWDRALSYQTIIWDRDVAARHEANNRQNDIGTQADYN